MADLDSRQDSTTEADPTTVEPATTEMTSELSANAEPKVNVETAREPETAVEPGPEAATAGESKPQGAEPAAESAAEPTANDADELTPISAVPKWRLGRLSRRSALITALTGLLVALVASGALLFVHNRGVSAAAHDREVALQAARSAASELTTLTSDNAAKQIENLTREATGSFRDQIASYAAMFQAVLKSNNVSSISAITAAGIEKFDGNTASGLVTVKSKISSNQAPEGQLRAYRLAVLLQRDGERWLVSNVEFVQ
ncbi:MAG: hypothetical protein JO100_17085 [Pseudonocardia sp.]|nr:hypothetical protein [Pseudonocardia sp.]